MSEKRRWWSAFRQEHRSISHDNWSTHNWIKLLIISWNTGITIWIFQSKAVAFFLFALAWRFSWTWFSAIDFFLLLCPAHKGFEICVQFLVAKYEIFKWFQRWVKTLIWQKFSFTRLTHFHALAKNHFNFIQCSHKKSKRLSYYFNAILQTFMP